MPVTPARLVRCALLPVAAALLLGGCRDQAAAPGSPPAADSSLARDLALARSDASGPLIFNDAPLDAAAPASAAPAAPAPARSRTPQPAPRPSPRPAPRTAAARPAPLPRAPAPSPASETQPAAAPSGGVIGAGTRLGLSSNGRVCAATALPGDKLTATLRTGASGTNGVSIPAGSTVVLEVASIDRADPIERSRITFRVRSIEVDGDNRPADGDVASLASLEPVQGADNNARTKVIGGAVAGAVLGRILGGSTRSTVIGGAIGGAAGTAAARRGQSGDACLPDGSPLQLTLSRDLAVRSPRF